MTDTEINIAIAEACGWRRCGTVGHNETPAWKLPYERTVTESGLPSYTTDLNAMHEAEKCAVLRAKLFDYCTSLHTITGGELFFHATARQRAEAFLRTIGKWKE